MSCDLDLDGTGEAGTMLYLTRPLRDQIARAFREK